MATRATGLMFSGFMVNAWTVSGIVAVVAGVVGFFTVLRGSAFAAHAIPNGSFAGAAGASLVGVSTLFGLGVFAFIGALGIGLLGRRGRHDAVTALMLVMMLALGALFVSFSSQYAPEVYSLLFGEVLGISSNSVAPTLILGLVCIAAIAVLYRPLMLSSALPEVGEARGIGTFAIELAFLGVLALATAMTVPVVGTLLIFSLMIGAPAAARSLTDRPGVAMALSVAIALAIVWFAIAASYETDWPVGFFVGTGSAAAFVLARLWQAARERQARRRVLGSVA
ncbi:MAG TPA: metal ABC transporter permease [Solirubrobacterales bacterium]|jgi:zinc/manganese transport system permease protein|nr:metal ABC transporter permease [Solirubrobacterales bacterium]